MFATAQSPVGDYRVGPRDLLEIRVLEIPELNLERRVLESGNLDLPLLGQTSVSGLTATEIRDRLQALLTARFVNRANVSVTVKDFANKPVSILGAVTKAGPLNISGRWDLLQAITAAGGLAPGAGKKIHVLRHAENGLSDRLEIDTAELFVKSSQIWNIPIFPSDIVNVPPKTTVKIFLLGEFKTPGVLEFDSDDRVTLLPVVARAGGLTDRAARGSIRIKRRGPDGGYQEITVDYKRILSGKDPDPVLKAEDVILVKESFF
jgi:polysaccharide export outer membrane protein